MFVRKLILLTRSISPFSRTSSIVNINRIVWTQDSVNVQATFYSKDHRNEPAQVKTVDDEDRKRKLIELELESLRNAGHDVPDANFIKPNHWSELLKMNTRSRRQKYYYFLCVTQRKIEAENIIKQKRALAYEAFKEQRANDDRPDESRFLLRIYDQTMNKWRNQRLFRAMQFSEKIIFDCSYDQYMTRQEAYNAALQLMRVFSVNRQHRDPYDLHFCNVNFKGPTFKRFASMVPTLHDKTFPLNLHETSYLDVFPKKKLVYLTPHCKTDLSDYDPDSIYIVGAMVDTSNHEPLSMMKAKELGIKMAKLPLERYLDWGHGDKTLTLDQMMQIMLAWRASNSWDKALSHIPRRKVIQKDVVGKTDGRSWTANVNKFKANYVDTFKAYYGNSNSFFDTDSDTTGLSIAEKFKRKPATSNQWSNKFDENSKPNFDTDSDTTGLSIAEKFKRKPATGNQWSNKFDENSKPNFGSGTRDNVTKPNRTKTKPRVDIKKVFDE